MRIISEPRLQRLKANNKLKASRLKRKAHLARVSRKKKAQKLDGMKAENERLRREIERLQRLQHQQEQEERQRVERDRSTQNGSNVKMECIRRVLVEKPQWMMNVEEMQQRLTLDEGQIARCNKEVVPNINMIEQNISNSKAYIDRLKSNNEEKIMLQQLCLDSLASILTKDQMTTLTTPLQSQK